MPDSCRLGAARFGCECVHSFLVVLCLDYLAVTFLLLEVDETVVAWGNLGYIGHVALAGMLLVGYVGPMLLPDRDKPKPKAA
jgi:hypothetical protein